jgi:hypothetical protein
VDGLRHVAQSIWGRIVLLDFSCSLLLIGAWICVLEPRRWRGLVIASGVLILGTPVAFLYLIARARKTTNVTELFLKRL